jgi:hypothetical protein
MKNIRLLSTVLAAVLAGATVSQAQIVAELESPADVQAVSGINLLRGWAFSEGEDEEVNVQILIDGIISEDLSVACCSSRQDVVDEHGAGTRLDSGFGAVVNYAELSPGPHTIGVHLSATDETSVIINHSVFVIRPGNTDFVDTVDLSGATCAISGNTIMLTGVEVDGTTTDLEAEYATDLQAFTLTGASGAPALTQFVANLTSNQEVPRVDTDSEGTATVTLNPDNTLTYAVTTTSLEEATAAHIHLGSATEAGPIIFPLTGGPTNWAGTTGVLSAEQLTALNEGRLYINVHTLENPNGEIRGTIVAAP